MTRNDWYRELLEPVRAHVGAALRDVQKAEGDGAVRDPWSVPRAGLGGAFVVHVARGFGARRFQDGGRLAVAAIEAYNQRVHAGAPPPAARAAWLARDVARLRRVVRGMVRRDDALVRRVLERVLGASAGRAAGSPGLGDEPVPEGVLFLRSAVAAGVLAGEVPDAAHAALDRYATWLGLAWETAHGALLPPDTWRGALAAVGVRDDAAPREAYVNGAAVARALGAARDALAVLPDGEPVERLTAVAARLGATAPPAAPSAPRAMLGWSPAMAPQPATAPPAAHVAARPDADADAAALARFAAQWRDPVERALARLAAAPASRTLQRAVDFLQHQGGKRVRPLVVLAAARAAGGDPARALDAAAVVEWLHQASLVLDDVHDEALRRRNAPTLHHATSVPFALGVAAFVLARLQAAMGALPEPARERLVSAATALVEGQRADLLHTGRAGLGEAVYARIVDGKTAQLFGCAAALGALAADAPPRLVTALARFGREAGMAFQLVDDLLDYTGDEATLGKCPGTDLRSGKVTLPVILLRARLAHPDERAALDALLAGGGATREPDAALAWVRERLARHDVPAACLARAREHLARGDAALAGAPDAHGAAVLRALAARFVERSR